jgi:hypothetical protein
MIGKLGLEPFRPAGFSGALMSGSDFHFKAGFLPSTGRKRTFAPSVVAALGNIQQPAERRRRIMLSQGFNLAVSHRDSFAK